MKSKREQLDELNQYWKENCKCELRRRFLVTEITERLNSIGADIKILK